MARTVKNGFLTQHFGKYVILALYLQTESWNIPNYKNTAQGTVKMERAKASNSEYLLPGALTTDCIKFTRYD